MSALSSRRWIGLCWLPLAVGCIDPPDIASSHKPLHPGNGAPVTFSVTANDSEGIARVELHLFEYEFSDAPSSQDTTAREGGQWGLAKAWDYPSGSQSISESFTYSPGFPPKSSISYLFRVTNTAGSSRSEEWIFAAGDWPFDVTPIPLLVPGPVGHRINVCFVADKTDYEVAADMLGDIHGLLFEGYHASNVIAGPNRVYWQFYYSPELGLTGSLKLGPAGSLEKREIPSSVEDASPNDYHAAIIHDSVLMDWASGSHFSTEWFRYGTAVHEAGHAVFDLDDEHPGGRHQLKSDPHHNNQGSEQAANAYNLSNAWPGDEAEVIVCAEEQQCYWRPEPKSLGCVMLDDLVDSDGDGEVDPRSVPDFARTCQARARWHYSKL